ncbi:MAG: ATP-dependent Clp protease proteolytic subunit [Erysipelotrichaceae bacterium]|nr:ATP-dependent Clp protease proteolytic subunit [Erysipelotrichaceae bacterium]
MNLTPIVIEQNGRGERSYDIYSRLLQDRIIILFGEITDATSASIISQLLFLSSTDEKKDIYIYINSPGGSVTSGLSIYDTMKYIKPRVVTIGMGLCASMGAFLLSSGDKRYALENTKVMIHQPLGGAKGQATDIMIVAEEIISIKKKLNEILSKNTKQPLSKIEQDTERDFYMDSKKALEYGIIDEIIKNNNKI